MVDVIILRSVFGKVGQKYFIQPCPNPKTNRLSECVKTVDSNGDMILSESDKEKQSSGEAFFIPEDEIFIIEDGFMLDLKKVRDRAVWEAIKYTNLIAKDRDERDANGNLIIDGGQKRYGTAELFIERPGEQTKRRVTKKQLVYRASTYIYDDTHEDRVKKCTVLGRDLRNAHEADVLDYLLNKAEVNPNEIIEMYEDDNWKSHLFVLTAVERGVITTTGGIFRYGDKTLAASLEATATMLRDPRYRTIYNSIKLDTFPEFGTQEEFDGMIADQKKELDLIAGETPKKEEVAEEKPKKGPATKTARVTVTKK